MSFWPGLSVLVTGGAGFIGSHLCDALLEQGARVRVVDDLSTGKRAHLAPGVEFLEGSILDQELMDSAARDVDVVYHMAVACLRASFARPEHVHEVNATGSLRTLEAARRCSGKLQRFIYCSTSEVYGTAVQVPMPESHPLRPTTVYGASKLAGEFYADAYAQTHGLPVTIVRPFNSYGPREHHEGSSGEVIPRFAVRIANGLAPLIYGSGEQTRDFTYVADTARGLMRVAESEAALGATLNLARGREVSILRVARLLLEKMGRRDLATEHRPERPADVLRHFADTSRTEACLCFRPGVEFEQGLDLYLNWFRALDAARLLEEVPAQNW